MEKGIRFEKLVADILAEKKYRVRHNVVKKKKGIRAQFDITYGIIKTTYVECKYRQSKKKINLDEVSTFVAKLKLFNISTKRGLFITNVNYDNRAKKYLTKMNVKYVDGTQLSKMYKKRLGLIKRRKFKSIEDIIKKYE